MEKIYTYEITENGYFIFINGEKVIHQYEPFIPDKTKSYEENAQEQIERLKKSNIKEENEKTDIEQLKEQITNLELAMTELYESEVETNGEDLL